MESSNGIPRHHTTTIHTAKSVSQVSYALLVALALFVHVTLTRNVVSYSTCNNNFSSDQVAD